MCVFFPRCVVVCVSVSLVLTDGIRDVVKLRF